MQVVEYGRARERLWLVHEKAKRQVVAHERRHVLAQTHARAQAAEHVAGEVGPERVVPNERDTPIPHPYRARRRLGGVVQQGTPAQRLPTRHLIGERLSQDSEQRRAVLPQHLSDTDICALALLARKRAIPTIQGVAGVLRGQLDHSLQHLERVPIHVAVVIAALLDPPHRSQLGQHDGRGVDLLQHLDTAQHAI
jgi:hypothetical protein